MGYPVAVIADTGDMFWGHSDFETTERYLRDRANLRTTAPGLRARPVPSRPYFRAAVHGRMLLRLAVAAAALVPVLLESVNGTGSALLGLLAVVAVIDAPRAAMWGLTTVPDPSRWEGPPGGGLAHPRSPVAGPRTAHRPGAGMLRAGPVPCRVRRTAVPDVRRQAAQGCYGRRATPSSRAAAATASVTAAATRSSNGDGIT